jgi:hypothetical protein
MKIPVKSLCALIIFSLFFLAGCASTKVTGEWQDENFTGKQFKKIMVIGVAKQPNTRRTYEDEFVDQLLKAGIMAISSHDILPRDKMLDKESIVKSIEGLGVDGVIITRLKDVTDKKQPYGRTYQTPYGGMYDYYNSSFTSAPATRVPTKSQRFGFETNLYDTGTEDLVFSITSDTYAQDNIDKRLDSYIKTVVQRLKQKKLI